MCKCAVLRRLQVQGPETPDWMARRGNTILRGITIFIFQNGRDLEDYVEKFVDTCHRASCDDVCLMEGLRSGSTFTLGEVEKDSNLIQPHLADVSQPDPEPSPPPPQLAEPEAEPTADGKPEPTATGPSPRRVTELEIATEPEPIKSNQDSTAHCTAEGERSLDLGLLEIELDLTNVTEDIHVKFPACSEQHTGLDFPPTLPVHSPPVGPATSALPPLSPGSHNTPPQPTIGAVDSPRVCQFPPRPFDSVAPSRLSAPSIVARRSTSSTIPPAPPWSVVVPPSPQDSTPLAAPRRSVPPAPSASVCCCSGSAVALRIFASVARALGSALALLILGVALDLRLFVSGSTFSAAVGPPPGVVSHSSTMAPPSVGSTVDYHRGCDLGLTWLLLLRVPSVSYLAQLSVVTTLDTSVSSMA
ncbi:tRNA modification GTPase MnmE [Labeo rohita]|uniref:tRNA modification GTPase MnmE n=1 Tax=Labeo rohita TaxID=84645 RepID=A0ABQ8L513_LABRO|nr:tRNA modification GTPase MnmE [Labeo rohita]